MWLKIISDGTVKGTRVVDAQTGEEVGNVTAVSWSMGNDGLTEAVVTLGCVPAEVAGEMEIEQESGDLSRPGEPIEVSIARLLKQLRQINKNIAIQ
jgi:hypothetical protein